MLRTKLVCSTAIAVAAMAAPALAQIEEITVTARKVEERLLDTPIAINAFTGDEIAARNIVNLQDLAQNTPGTNVVNQASGGARSDRSFQAVVMRGISPSGTQLQTSSIFIDGAPVASASAVQTITSPERVEILKGPQSAYFGRQTFAGAINVVNKMPSEEFGGKVSGTAATHANYDTTLELSGPLAGEVLGFRATARANGKHGSYENAAVAGTHLGNQSTKTGSLLLVAQPNDDFEVKAFGLLTDKRDGAPATGIISAYEVRDNSGALVAVNQSNCRLNNNANPYFCGTTPKLSALTPAQTGIVPQALLTSLQNPANRVVKPKNGPLDGYGLKARDVHLHLAADYDVSDEITLSSLTAYNKGRFSELADLDNLGSTNFTFFGSNTGYNFSFLIESISKDYSQEVRATYGGDGPFHATVGASYLYSRTQGATGGNGGSLIAPLQVTKGGQFVTKTTGGFFGLGYDVTPEFSLNFDGRYQVDKNATFAAPAGITVTSPGFGVATGFYAGGTKVVEGTYKNFMPRFIAQYKWDADNMLYASYSKGINPGVFNTGFLTPPATGVNQVAALVAANKLQVVVDPEKLTNYEIGAKGLLLDNKMRYELAAYYMEWRDQINSQSFFYLDNVGQVQQLGASSNTGSVNIKGLEAGVGFTLAKGLSLDLGAALTDAVTQTAVNAATTSLTGMTNFKGKLTPYTSKYSGTATLQYITPLVEASNLDGLIRIDTTMKSGTYTNLANNVKTPSITNVNLTLGVRNDTYTLEAFATNLFNSKAYYSAVDGVLVDASFTHFGTSSALVIQPRELRTIGVKGSVQF
jgi:iron complex outermembrane receptor protein